VIKGPENTISLNHLIYGAIAMLRLLCLSSFCLAAVANAAPQTPSPHAAPEKPTAQQPAKKNETFKPFTGKVIANKVRVRAKPDLDAHVVRQMNKADLLLVVSELGDFYGIEPMRVTMA
jgi:hypothetical protein